MAFAGGDGSFGNPWQIETAQQLDDLRIYTGSVNYNKYFILNNDIDLTSFLAPAGAGYNLGKFWDPIPDFYANVDGNGKSVTELKINRPATSNVGLFAVLGTYFSRSAYVHDITVVTAAEGILGHSNVGILSGTVFTKVGILLNVNTSGTIFVQPDTGVIYESIGGIFGKTDTFAPN